MLRLLSWDLNNGLSMVDVILNHALHFVMKVKQQLEHGSFSFAGNLASPVVMKVEQQL